MAQQTVTANWIASTGTSSSLMFGVNAWSACNLTTGTNTAYINCLTAMNPGFIRYENYGTIASSTAGGWLNTSNSTWQTSVIDSILTATKNCAPNKIMNIACFPPWMTATNGTLLPAYTGTGAGSYAQFCASLVKIADNNGTYIKYWEPMNELNGIYSGTTGANDMPALASIFINCRAAMQAVDNTILVGGPAFTNPWDSNYDAFFAAVAGNIDFITYHDYSQGSSQPIATLYSDAMGGGGASNYVWQQAFNQGIPENIPIFCDEWNMYDSWNDDTTGEMASPDSAVYDALKFTSLIQWGNALGSTSFNDADNTYGKMNPAFTGLRQSGQLNALLNSFMTGSWCLTFPSNSSVVNALATRSGTQRALMLICESATAQNVTVAFQGLDKSSFTITDYTVSSATNTYTTSNINYSGSNLSIAMAPNSVQILVFNDDIQPGPSITNGSFETPLTTAWPYYLPNWTNPASINTAASWNFSGDAGIQRNGSGFGVSTPSGVQTAFLGSSGGVAGSMSQNVSFATSGTYRLSFVAANCNAGAEPIQVSVNGTKAGSPISASGTTFNAYASKFTISTPGIYTVALTSTDLSGSCTALIDDVQIDQYPSGAISQAGWVATASSSGAWWPPVNAIDGNTSTCWSSGTSQASGQWFEVNLGQSVSFSSATVLTEIYTTDYMRGYQFQVSTNGSTWTTVASGSGSNLTTISFPTQTAQYARLVLTASSSYYWAIDEFNLFH